MNGGPTEEADEPIEQTAAIAGPAAAGRAPGGAEQQRHAVGDAEADEREAGQRGGGLPTSSAAPSDERGERARRRAAARSAPSRAMIESPPIRPIGHAGGEGGEARRGDAGARPEVLAQVERRSSRSSRPR